MCLRNTFFFVKSVQYGGNYAWICGILAITNERAEAECDGRKGVYGDEQNRRITCNNETQRYDA